MEQIWDLWIRMCMAFFVISLFSFAGVFVCAHWIGKLRLRIEKLERESDGKR